MIPNARLCKALLDRITDRAHILETGTESYRFRRTMNKHKTRNETAGGDPVSGGTGGLWKTLRPSHRPWESRLRFPPFHCYDD